MTATPQRVREALAWLEQRGSARVREEARTRYGIDAPKSYGVKIGEIQRLAKTLGTDHELAQALWKTGWYEARLLCAYVDDPEQVTAAQMDAWCRDFDNWGVVDTVCFKLFDRSPLAWKKVAPWCRQPGEYQRRAGLVLLACLAAHDKSAPDEKFLDALPLIERYADDERNFVKKGALWALRMIGGRRSTRAEALAMARRLGDSDDVTARWIGKTALREIAKRGAKTTR